MPRRALDGEELPLPIDDLESIQQKKEAPEEDEGSESSSSAGSVADRGEQAILDEYIKWDLIPLVSGSTSSSYSHVIDENKDVREG